MRLLDDRGDVYALGIAADQQTVLRRVERDLALSTRLVSQSPIGLAVLDTELRYVLVNPALERINGMPAEDHVGRGLVGEVLPLSTSTPSSPPLRAGARAPARRCSTSTTSAAPPADPDTEHAWSVSCYRLEDPGGRVLGVAASVVDVTEQHRAATEADRARRRLALIADASARIGTTLDVDQTAHELADVAVPELADVAAVDVLDAVLLADRRTARPGTARRCSAPSPSDGGLPHRGAARRRPARRRSPPTTPTGWSPSACTRAGRSWCAHVGSDDLRPHRPRRRGRRAAGPRPASHSYLAVPLIARGEVLGALDLNRARNPQPFDEDDVAARR